MNKHYKNEPIRGVSISASNLVDSSETQLNLFEQNNTHSKEKKLLDTIDEIKKKYGRNAVRRASTEFEYSTAKARNKEIGGHHE